MLATYFYERHYHLIFPWADGNLQDFWKKFPKPQKSYEQLLWIAKQCHGLTEALNRLHNDDFGAAEALTPKNGGKHLDVKDNAHKSGRHGDIKPKNILWFEEAGGPVLKLCDFGLTKFHRKVSEFQQYETLLGSRTYRAPEFDLTNGVSPMYDMWALGCVFLEFISWYLLGYQEGIVNFSQERLDDDIEIVKEDTYFIIREKGAKLGACQKKCVKKVSVLASNVSLRHLD